MNITAITVCVDYSDYLSPHIGKWRKGIEKMIVVSDEKDEKTNGLCMLYNALCHRTGVFYANGASFNKGAALSEAIAEHRVIERADWVLLFDADMIPPDGWRQKIEVSINLQRGWLYGANRRNESGKQINDNEIAGYFQLFHASDDNVQRKPLLETCWRHAGSYDTEFQSRWPRGRRAFLPLTLIHQGPHSTNWWGRGNVQAMQEMRRFRSIYGNYEYEKIKPVSS